MSLLRYTSEAEASIFDGWKASQAKVATVPSRAARSACPAEELQCLAGANPARDAYVLFGHWGPRLADIVVDFLLNSHGDLGLGTKGSV